MSDFLPASGEIIPLCLSGQIIVVNKPPGLPTQAPSGIDSMEVRVKRFLANQDGGASTRSGQVYLGVPHRLDRPASGVMVFARTKNAARHLARQFQERTVGKSYWAVVSGVVAPTQGTWIDTMRKIPDEARSEICEPDTDGARRAVLHYRRRPSAHPATLLEIRLETGRSHQIRLQAASRGHPLLGDDLYGSDILFGPPTPDLRQRSIALHARSLVLVDPETEQPVSFAAEPPEFWPD